jgi:hypothetical protein
MGETRDSVRDVWGARTPYRGRWPARVDEHLAEEPDRWVVTQRLLDPAGDGEWHFVAAVDLELARAEGAPTLQLEFLGPFGARDSPG